MLTPADHQRVHEAIAAAEAATTGEIFCVVAQESGAYREVPFAWAAALALTAPLLTLLIGWRPWEGLGGGGWSAGPEVPGPAVLLLAYAVTQALIFALALLAISAPPLRRLLTPPSVKRDRVHARALEQFAHRLHATEAETGVLIYASLAERRVEVIADEVIHAKVGDAAWNAAVAAALAQIKRGDTGAGLIAAIQACGAVLAEHCPSAGGATPRPHGGVVEV